MGRAPQASELWDQANKNHNPVQSKSDVATWKMWTERSVYKQGNLDSEAHRVK